MDQLKEYVSYKSRSNYEEEVKICANYNKGLLEDIGLEVEIIETTGNPVVLGKKTGSLDTTVLIYGHYDVQHEGDLSLWESDPFEAEIRGDKLYGRGTADNKGQHFAHIKALEYIKLHLPDVYEQLNVSVILDGDEERSSFSLPEVFRARKNELRADITIVSDGPSLVEDAPTIVGSVRGILTFQITIRHNPEDLHSGNFGGLARSATLDMIHLLADMVDENGKAKIPGFYDNVVPPSNDEVELLNSLKPVFDAIQQNRDYTTAKIQKDQTVYSQNQFWPTFNINGISSGGVKKERRTIIPAEITASIDCRLVPNMTSDSLRNKIETFISNWAKENQSSNTISVTSEAAMEPVQSSLDNPNLAILREAMAYGFDVQPVLVPRLGGSLPLYVFPEYLDRQVFLVPLALPDENNHAPNENLDIPYFEKGVISMVKFYQLLVK